VCLISERGADGRAGGRSPGEESHARKGERNSHGRRGGELISLKRKKGERKNLSYLRRAHFAPEHSKGGKKGHHDYKRENSFLRRYSYPGDRMGRPFREK